MAPSPRTIVAASAALGACLVIAAACKRAASDKVAPVAPPLASKAFYRLDAGPAQPCTVGATCSAQLIVTALGAYHVNKDYPTKFIAAPGVPLDGPPAFALTDATHGTMSLRFKPTSPGTTTLAGTFKLSVCSDDTCEIEQPAIKLAVAVR